MYMWAEASDLYTIDYGRPLVRLTIIATPLTSPTSGPGLPDVPFQSDTRRRCLAKARSVQGPFESAKAFAATGQSEGNHQTSALTTMTVFGGNSIANKNIALGTPSLSTR